MEIDRTTLGRNLQKPTRKFLIRLTEAGVPVPDSLINPVAEIFISEDGVEGMIIKENNSAYTKDDVVNLRKQLLLALQEIKELKAENYDLKKQLEGLKNANS